MMGSIMAMKGANAAAICTVGHELIERESFSFFVMGGGIM